MKASFDAFLNIIIKKGTPLQSTQESMLPLTLTLFEKALLSCPSPVAVAVSGGADSLALLLLTQRWARQTGGRVVALTVDHGLRPNSAQEARRVQEWAVKWGIEHHILTWEGDKPSSCLQEKARDARYQLLISWCKAHATSTLLLGHHAQDQEETFWLRLSSGSGLTGLSGMRDQWVKDGVTLLRPLLGVQQAHLKEVLKAENQDWIEDPSNENPRFFRGRFRSFLKEEGLSSERLLKTMEKLQEDADFIQESLTQTLKTQVQQHEGGYISLPQDGFAGLHPALGKRMVSYLMQWFSGQSYAPRSQQLQEVLTKLKTGLPFTAGGIYWFLERGKIYLTREPIAFDPPLFLKDVSEKTLWDQRFWVDPTLKTYFPEDAFLGPLKRGKATASLKTEIPRRIVPTLPAIWVKEKVVAVPHFCYTLFKSEKGLEKNLYVKPLFHDSLRITM